VATTIIRSQLFERAAWLQRASGLLILIVVAMILSLLSENFLTVSNLTNIALQTSIVALVTIGMALTMLMAGIDLSVGSIAALAGALAAGLMTRNGWSIAGSMLAGVAVGAGLGLVNGLLSVYGRLPPFVATLAMLGIARGFTLVYTEGKPISGLDRAFTFWGTGSLGPVPMPVVVWIVVLMLVFLAVRYTRFGLYIYAIGGNEETARLAGIRINAIKLTVYSLSGALAGLTGLLLTARLFSAQPQMGTGMELDAIAAAVLGGVSLFGGVGNIVGACIGALIVGMIGNGLNLLRVPSYYQQVIKGVVFIVAVIIDLYTKGRGK
jgi:ribose transport system permease protein